MKPPQFTLRELFVAITLIGCGVAGLTLAWEHRFVANCHSFTRYAHYLPAIWTLLAVTASGALIAGLFTFGQRTRTGLLVGAVAGGVYFVFYIAPMYDCF